MASDPVAVDWYTNLFEAVHCYMEGQGRWVSPTELAEATGAPPDDVARILSGSLGVFEAYRPVRLFGADGVTTGDAIHPRLYRLKAAE